MSGFIENDLEQAALEWFQDLGYQTQYGPDISPGGSFSERKNFGDVVLYDRLHSALTNSILMIRFQNWLKRLLVSKACLLSKIMLHFRNY